MIPLAQLSAGEIGADLALLAARLFLLLILIGPLFVPPLICAAARAIRSIADQRRAGKSRARSRSRRPT